MEQKKRSYKKWTDEEVGNVLGVLAEEEIQRDVENIQVYEWEAKELVDMNEGHMAKQIHEKLRRKVISLIWERKV